MNWLVQSAKYKRVYDKKTGKNFYFRINFVTLTVPHLADCPSDHRLKKDLFHPFIQYARKYFGLRNYVWRAEAQANGMLHFHLTTDTFLHHRKIRTVWNRLLRDNGLLSDYEAKHGNSDPNSTDVHSVKNVKDLAAYLAKYLTKDDATRRKVTGRLWGCNYALSHEKKCVVHCDPDQAAYEHRKLFKPEIPFKDILGKPDVFGKMMYLGTVFFVTETDWGALPRSLIREAYDNRRFEIRNNVADLPPEYFSIN